MSNPRPARLGYVISVNICKFCEKYQNCAIIKRLGISLTVVFTLETREPANRNGFGSLTENVGYAWFKG